MLSVICGSIQFSNIGYSANIQHGEHSSDSNNDVFVDSFIIVAVSSEMDQICIPMHSAAVIAVMYYYSVMHSSHAAFVSHNLSCAG